MKDKRYTYDDGETIDVRPYPVGSVITIYAFWDNIYEYLEPLDFTGSNYIDTHIKLFNTTNIKKDFLVTFDLEEFIAPSYNQATIFNTMYEGGNPYQGAVVRVSNNANKTMEVKCNVNASTKISNTSNFSTLNTFKLKREGEKIYYSVNDGDYVFVADYTNFTNFFNGQASIGASLKGTGAPQRWFKGRLSNMRLELESFSNISYSVRFNANGGYGSMSNQNFDYYERKKLSPNQFTYPGHEFGCWCTTPDGTGTRYYADEDVSAITAVDGEIVDLYAIWTSTILEYSGTYVFDGTINNIIDTGLELHNVANAPKDFEISFNIDAIDALTNEITLINTKNEANPPANPGFVLRINSARKLAFSGTNLTAKFDITFYPTDVSTFKIVRRRRINLLFCKWRQPNICRRPDGCFSQCSTYNWMLY